MTLKVNLAGAAIMASMAAPTFAADVVIAVPNWPSAIATAYVLKVVMEDKLGQDVEMQNGTNPVIFEAMNSGSMQVHPEVWLPNQQNLHDTYVKEKGTVKTNAVGVAAFNGICVTKETVEMTGITSVSELSDPEIAQKFDKDGDGKGEIWIGGAGWASTNVEKIRAKSYGFDETMNLIEMDESLAMAEVDSSVAQHKPVVFNCYAPHHMFALYDLVKLKEPEHDPDQWVIVQPTDDPEWLEHSSAPVAWPAPHLFIHYATALEDTNPTVASMLHNVQFDTDIISAMTYSLVVEKQDPEEFAHKWVSENSAMVDGWLQ